MSVKRNPNLLSSQARAKRRRLFLVRFYIIVFIFLFVLFTLAILSGHKKVTIQTFIINGNNSISDEQILEIARRDISGRYVGLFAKNNSLIFPRFKIERDLLTEIKTFTSVKIDWQNLQTIAITVSERKPHSVWCGPNPKATEEKCFFVDQLGFIYDQAPIFTGNVFIKNYYKELPSETYVKIYSLIDFLNKKSIEVNQVYFDGVDFRFYLATGPVLIFNDKEGGFEKAFDNMFTAIESKNLDLINGAKKIDYVDLRFESKVVVGKKDAK